MTYDETDKLLLSADAFGSFRALNGTLFADEVDFDREVLDEAPSPGYGGFPDSFFPYRLLVRWISHYGRALHKQPSDAAFPAGPVGRHPGTGGAIAPYHPPIPGGRAPWGQI